ncbi:MAG: membrane dipeptidase [Flavobacteriales bacterium]
MKRLRGRATDAPTPLSDARFDAARALHRALGVVDLHVDCILQASLFGYDIEAAHRPGRYGQPRFNHVDVPRMVEAGYSGAYFGVHYFPWQSERGWRSAMKQLSRIDALCERDDRLYRVRRASDWDKAREAGCIGIAAGFEGAHLLNERLDRVQWLAENGVSYLTLAHFSKNAAATPSMGIGADEESGLTDFGIAVVEELQVNGVCVDTAHLNMPCVHHACRISRAPMFCTHTGAKGVHDVARCIDDIAIKAIADTGGVIGIIFSPHFLTGQAAAGTEAIIAHAQYIKELVGAQHVALGSDYDGWLPAIPSDHRDCRDILRVTAALLEAGFTETETRGVLRENALRAHQGCEAAASTG